ncbi:MAG: hypothetical protein KF768_12520 [Phycisphaeraceae bacterium]|nr:hypothetical protein [Phycisphaeraceae bacterium]
MTAPLTTTSPRAILGPDGPIARHLGDRFESRPEQIAMAEAVARAMAARGVGGASGAGGPDAGVGSRLAVEAGTGVGKSFAYLIPAVLRCILHGEKVVIATATISLQEQLITKDIPLIQETLASWNLPAEHLRADLVPVLAKGRGNYVSIRRLQMASSRQEALLPDAQSRASLHVIEDWAYETADGSLSTLPALERPEVWDHVRSDTDNCMGRKCPNYKDCFYQTARRRMEQANLIVCNHALFFADLALRTQSATRFDSPAAAILPGYHHVIFDEAHNLEDAAAGHFGLSLSEPRVRRLLRTLYSSRRRRGYLSERSLSMADGEAVDRAIGLVIRAEDATTRYFDQLLRFHRSRRGAAGRLRRADVDEFENPLSPALRDLALRLRTLREGVKNEQDRFELSSFAKRAAELGLIADALITQSLGERAEREGAEEEEDGAGFDRADFEDGPRAAERATKRHSSAAAPPAYVYWVDVEGDGPRAGGGEWDGAGQSERSQRFGPRVTIACAPVDVAPLLRRHLFDPASEVVEAPLDEGGEMAEFGGLGGAGVGRVAGTFRPSITLTSATLATRCARAGEMREHAESAFAHLINNLGLPQPPDTALLQLGSPFDYASQAELVVDLTVPNPRGAGGDGGGGGGRGGLNADGYHSALSGRILHHVRSTDGHAFVLFTSFGTLNACARLLRPKLEELGMPLFAQGVDGPRAMILKRFVESPRSVLFGAASFWQGVDVRGDRLRNVIITRLPFEPPDRPITQARIERLEAQGVNPFMYDSLPRAIIRFKQGFGRLIRSASDTGRVVVLDPRIATTGYGRRFIEALPAGVPVRTVEQEWHDAEPDEC